MASKLKRIKTSDSYKYVDLYHKSDGEEIWKVQMFGKGTYKKTERDAAIAADLMLISNGKNPVNILVRK